LDDTPALDADLATESGLAGAIEDVRVADDKV
jgi:hypothetical protein